MNLCSEPFPIHLKHFPSGVMPWTLLLQGFVACLFVFIPTETVELVLTVVFCMMILNLGRTINNVTFTDSDVPCTDVYCNILAKGGSF